MFAEYLVRGPAQRTRKLVERVMADDGLRLSWDGDDALAQHGTPAANFFLGALAQRVAFPITVRPHPEGFLLRVDEGDRGWMGGLIGRGKVRRRHGRVCAALEEALAREGLLVRRHDGRMDLRP